MNWNDLRYFLAVQRTGTLAGAARTLKVEHTTVSRRLAALESDLGVQLFTRAPDGFLLTDAGADLLPQAEAMERSAEAVSRQLGGRDRRVEGTVRLTTSEGFSGFLAKRLGPLRQRHPELLVEILASNAQLDLSRGEADLALRLAPTTDPDLVARRVGSTGWSLYAAEGYVQRCGRPASSDDLSGHELVNFAAALSRVPGAVWLGEGRGARTVLRANGLGAALNATIGGLGLGVLPCVLGDAEPALLRLTLDLLVTCDAWLVVHRDLLRVPRVRTVREFLLDLMEREAAVLRGDPSARTDDASAPSRPASNSGPERR